MAGNFDYSSGSWSDAYGWLPNPNWGSYNPYGDSFTSGWTPWGVYPSVPQPCVTCNRCPTCGSYKPMDTWTATSTLSGVVAGAIDSGPLTVDTCPSDPNTDCSHD